MIMVINILVQGIYTLNCYLCVCMVKIIVSRGVGKGGGVYVSTRKFYIARLRPRSILHTHTHNTKLIKFIFSTYLSISFPHMYEKQLKHTLIYNNIHDNTYSVYQPLGKQILMIVVYLLVFESTKVVPTPHEWLLGHVQQENN